MGSNHEKKNGDRKSRDTLPLINSMVLGIRNMFKRGHHESFTLHIFINHNHTVSVPFKKYLIMVSMSGRKSFFNLT